MSEILGAGPLTWITFLPILGMVIIILIPSGKDDIEPGGAPPDRVDR